ncbi:MAG TPA: hypothetical protein VN493_30925 [Thermoanaerobaculia bacterium]|nr:hypothetical protein [Thermoanaerobaculia bacterium]
MPRFLSRLFVSTLSLISFVSLFSGAEPEVTGSGDTGSGLEPNG